MCKSLNPKTKNLIDIQDNVGESNKAKVIANREMLSTKIQLIKSYDKQILDSNDTEADIGKGDLWKQWVWKIGKWTYYFY